VPVLWTTVCRASKALSLVSQAVKSAKQNREYHHLQVGCLDGLPPSNTVLTNQFNYTVTKSGDDNEQSPPVKDYKKADSNNNNPDEHADNDTPGSGGNHRVCINCFWLPTCDKVTCAAGQKCVETPQSCRKCGTAKCYPDL
jgi:hypothetical protein